MKRVLAVLLGFVALAAACSTSDDSGGDSATGDTTIEDVLGDPGDCTVVGDTHCFVSPITATGDADPAAPRTVATTCLPPTSNPSVNSVFGLPGPGRVRTDWFVTLLE